MPEAFLHALDAHWISGLPFVAYRKPGEAVVNALFQDDRALRTVEDLRAQGFVMAPFDPLKPRYLLSPHRTLSVTWPGSQTGPPDPLTLPGPGMEGKNAFEDLVRRALQDIASGHLRKVVVSRRIRMAVDGHFTSYFRNLLNAGQEAMCYVWYHPETGLWMGATPETLVHISGGAFATMSLAGTKHYNEKAREAWGSKETEEQQLVTRYIREILEGCAEGIVLSPTRTVRAGNLVHLRTDISGRIPETGIEALVNALHPTPAVCGMPRAEAMAFILQNEGYDRGFYTGYLGELNMADDVSQSAHLFVNIRCLKLERDRASIYVGGGITGDSLPEAEFMETCGKSATMMGILMNSLQ